MPLGIIVITTNSQSTNFTNIPVMFDYPLNSQNIQFRLMGVTKEKGSIGFLLVPNTRAAKRCPMNGPFLEQGGGSKVDNMKNGLFNALKSVLL